MQSSQAVRSSVRPSGNDSVMCNQGLGLSSGMTMVFMRAIVCGGPSQRRVPPMNSADRPFRLRAS